MTPRLFPFSFTILFGLFLLGNVHSAGPRLVNFSQIATNRVSNPLSEPIASTCVISISNTSNVDQNVQLSVTATASGLGAGDAKLISSSGDPKNFTIEAEKGVRSFSYEYPPVSPGQVGTQTLICRGTIGVLSTDSPGFLSASGALSVFHESSRMVDRSAPGKPSVIGSGIGALFKSTIITINQGKPF